MNKNAKIIIVTLLFIALCLCLSMCSEDIGSGVATIISGEDGKCDYCGAKMSVKDDGKEYCSPCYHKYDGDFWD